MQCRGPEAGAFRMALWLAFFNQAFASTAIINYAPEVLRRAGVSSHRAAALFTSAVGASKVGKAGSQGRRAASLGPAWEVSWQGSGNLGGAATYQPHHQLTYLELCTMNKLALELSCNIDITHRGSERVHNAAAGAQMVGVVLSFLLVDSLGRRPLLLYGSLGCAAAMGVLVAADWLSLVPFLVAGMCAFIFAFRSVSQWVGMCSDLFPSYRDFEFCQCVLAFWVWGCVCDLGAVLSLAGGRLQ